MSTYSEMTIVISQKEVLKKEASRLFAILDLYSEEELTKFKKFLDSPFFNNDELLRKLYQKIRPKKNITTKQIQGKTLLKIFEEVDEKRGLEKLKEKIMSLSKLGMECLAHLEVQTNHASFYRVLSLATKKRKSKTLFEESAQKYEQVLSKQAPTLMRAVEEWWISHHQYFHQFTEQGRPNNQPFHVTDQQFEQFFQLTKLRYYCEFLNRKNIVGDQFEVNLPKLQNINYESDYGKSIQLYQAIIPLIESKIFLSKPYDQFEEKLYEWIDFLAPEDQLVLIKFSYNILLKAIRQGHELLLARLNRLAKLGVNKGIYTFEGRIRDSEYLNIAIMAGVGGEFDFQKTFMEDFKHFLIVKDQHQAYFLVLAYHYFHQDFYQKSLETLNAHFPLNSQNEPRYMLRTKGLRVRNHFGLYLLGKEFKEKEKTSRKSKGETSPFQLASATLKKFLKRKENKNIKKEHKDSYTNMIEMCKHIQRYQKKLDFSKKTQVKIQNDLHCLLDQLSPIVGKLWFRKKINELKRVGSA